MLKLKSFPKTSKMVLSSLLGLMILVSGVGFYTPTVLADNAQTCNFFDGVSERSGYCAQPTPGPWVYNVDGFIFSTVELAENYILGIIADSSYCATALSFSPFIPALGAYAVTTNTVSYLTGSVYNNTIQPDGTTGCIVAVPSYGPPPAYAPYGIVAGRTMACPAGYNNYSQWPLITPDNQICARLSPPAGESLPPSKTKNAGPCLPCSTSASAGNPISTQTGSTSTGDPVTLGDGNRFITEEDYVGQGRFPLVFKRYYNSDYNFSNDTNSIPSTDLGPGWSHSYQQRLTYVPEQTASVVQYPTANDRNNQTNGTPTTITTPAGLYITREDGRTYYESYDDSTHSFITSPEFPNTLAINVIVEDGLFFGPEEISGYTLTTPDNNIEAYNGEGLLASITNPSGLTQTIIRNANDIMIGVVDPDGRVIDFTYDGRSSLSSLSLPDGQTVTYAYNTANPEVIKSVSYPTTAPTARPTRQYAYDGSTANNLITIKDENNVVNATFNYITGANYNYTTSEQNYGGANALSIAYTTNTDGSLITQAAVTDSLGSITNYAFTTVDDVALLSSKSLPCAAGLTCTAATSYTYDSTGEVISMTDYNGNVTVFSYDSTRRLETSRTEGYGTPSAQTRTIAWLSGYRLPAEIVEPGRTTDYAYDSNANLLSKTITSGSDVSSWHYTYDSGGRVQTVTDPNSNVTTIVYNTCSSGGGCGLPATVTDALGHITTFNSYDGAGRLLSMTDPNGLITTMAYTARGKLATRTVGSETTTLTYDPAQNLTAANLPNGQSFTYGYDGAHRLTSIVDQTGSKITYTLNGMGDVTATKIYNPSNVLVGSQSSTFDAANRLKTVVGLTGQTTTIAHDSNGNPTSVTDPLSHITGASYDSLDRLSSITNPASNTLSMTYDGLDQTTSVTDYSDNTTGYSVDGLGHVSSISSPDTGSTSQTYDPAGNVLTVRDAKAQTTTMSYDALERLGSLTKSDGSVIRFYYDTGTYGIGHLTGLADQSGSTGFSYDIHGRLIGKSQIVGSITLNTGWSYDSGGRLSTMTYPSGKELTYTWTSGQITAVAMSGSNLASSIAYQPFAGPKSWTFGNGESGSRTYDADYRITGEELATNTYDHADRITGIAPTSLDFFSGASGAKTYGYDSLDRLTSYSSTSDTIGYGYNTNSNRTSQSGEGLALTSTIFSGNNQISNLASGGVNSAPTYDANGSITAAFGNTYTYGPLGQMTASANSGNSTLGGYAYNGFGQRVEKSSTVSGTTTLTIFNYDATGQLIGEYDGSGNPVEETVYLGDMPVAVFVGSSTYYVHSDHLNTPRQIDNAGGSAVWAWDIKTYGLTQPNENPSGVGSDFVYNLRMPGQYFDIETGTFYNNARDYEPRLGRYLESDPIGLGGGSNTYEYVGGNPTSFSDPLGLAVYYANHLVGLNIYHSFIMIIPDEQDKFRNNRNFTTTEDNNHGEVFMTLGAGIDWAGRLTSGINRYKDVHEECKNVIPLDIPSIYANETELIKKMVGLTLSYNDNKVLYSLFPIIGNENSYNSNGFISGLLLASGIVPPANTGDKTPGYAKPVPVSNFH